MYRMNRASNPHDEDDYQEGEEEDGYGDEYYDPQVNPDGQMGSPRQAGRLSPRNPKSIRPDQTNSSLSGKDAVGLLGMSMARMSQRDKNKKDATHPRDAWKQFLNSNPDVLKQNPSLITVENASDVQRLGVDSAQHKQLGKSAPSHLGQSGKTDDKLKPDADKTLKDSQLAKSRVTTQGEVVKKFVPFFCNMVENRIKSRLKDWSLRVIKDRFVLQPKRVRFLEKIEKVIQKSAKQSFFDQMEVIMEQESILSEKLREFYRLNLKRIFFTTLKSFGHFQKAWIDQVRSTILKGIVFETIKRNHVEEKVARKVEGYHISRLLRAWHRQAEVGALESNKIIEEFQGHTNAKIATKVIKELRTNALAGKQERRRDLDSILQYQRVRIYRIFEFWKTQAAKRKKPVDFSKYHGLNSIPMRITQKKTVELLEDDLNKVLKSKAISTTIRLLHPSTKTS